MPFQRIWRFLMNKEIECTVYKSLKKDETYVFIPTETLIADLPDELKKVLGETEKVMSLTITPEKKMARGTGAEVMKNIKEQGFHLQMPENPLLTAVPSYGDTLEDKNIS